VIPESVDSEQTANFDEFRSGINQLLGWNKTDERMVVDVVLSPKADTKAHAKTALNFPAGPIKVTLSGFDAFQGSGTPDIRDINGDYIYLQGARRTLQKGQASFRLPLFRPLDVPDPYLVGGEVTVAAVTAYINALVTPIT
jgi:hypothetical protein